jgi:hypothetical protein
MHALFTMAILLALTLGHGAHAEEHLTVVPTLVAGVARR